LKFPEPIIKKIESIKNDKKRGASELAILAVETFKELILSEEEVENKKIEELVRTISSSRPSMFPISNHAKRLGKLLYNSDKPTALKIIANYIEELKKKNRRIIKNAEFLKSFSIVTCSYSSIVEKFLKKFIETLQKVIVCESRWEDISYGKKYIERIKSSKIILFPDKEIENLSGVDCGIIGADGVTLDGKIINGKPSLAMCTRLKILRKPVWVMTGLDKFGESIDTVEEGFDLIPASLIKGFITESGILNFEEFCSTAKSLYQ